MFLSSDQLTEFAEDCENIFHWTFTPINPEEFFELLKTRDSFILGLDVKDEGVNSHYHSLIFRGHRFITKTSGRSYNSEWN